MLSEGTNYRGFLVTKSIKIPELQCHLTELQHEKSGAQVLHVAADDPENFFCLSFQTLPPSSNGVAHILEHTVLTGSKRYPVIDPFFSMTRRSLNTFMNALTGADFTCYPAASQVEQDFYNLLSVYLDAVFQPLLKEQSFAQEGHRLEFSLPQDPTSPLIYKGIVYNEMKGAMTSPTTRLNEAMSVTLFPESPYGFNSGGDPRDIPSLSYKELVAFHKKYYHPSKCLFFFYGNLPLEKHLDFILEHALAEAEKELPLPPFPRQPRFSKEVRKELFYPVVKAESEEGEESDEKTLIGFGWLTTSILERQEVLALNVLDTILMDSDASLLKRALLASGLCKQAGSSLDTENAEVPFTIVLKGCKSEDAELLEQLIRTTLMRIVEEKIPEKLIESALHQMELDRVEIGQNGEPFGLSLFARSALMKQHGGKAENGLRIHSLFQELRQSLHDNPDYLHQLIVKYLLNNHHFTRICLQPSQELAQQEAAIERETLDAIQKKLTPKEAEEIVQRSQALYAFQEHDDSGATELLPKISLHDVPKKGRNYELKRERRGNVDLFFHPTFTNHLVYLDLVFPLPELPEEDLWLARLFTQLISQVGSAERSYVENLEYIQENTGGIGSGFSLNHQVHSCSTFTPALHVKGKALYRNADKFFRLMFDTVTAPNFTERSRLKELISKYVTQLQSSINQQALRYAVSLSSCHKSHDNFIQEEWYGVRFFHKMKQLAQHFEKEASHLIERLQGLQDKLLCTQGAHLVVTCDETEYNKFIEAGFEGLVDIPGKPFAPWKNHFSLPKIKPHARVISSPVAFNARAFKSLSYTHHDAAAVALAANIFDNTTLHRRIREQGGAYGGGTSYNPTSGNFYFYSYRDPHIASTARAFEEAIETAVTGGFDASDLEEAKLEMVQGLDGPVSPGSRAEIAYARFREGKTDAVRQAFRERLLGASCADVTMAVEKYIAPGYRESVLVSFAGRELIEQENKKLNSPLHIEKV